LIAGGFDPDSMEICHGNTDSARPVRIFDYLLAFHRLTGRNDLRAGDEAG
jgi:hypothetical protein